MVVADETEHTNFLNILEIKLSHIGISKNIKQNFVAIFEKIKSSHVVISSYITNKCEVT